MRFWGLVVLLSSALAVVPSAASALGPGTLRPVSCIGPGKAAKGCKAGRALGGVQAVAIGRGGETVYVASGSSDAIAVLSRDTRTGALTQKSGKNGCVSRTGGSCAKAASLDAPSDIATSADGRFVYVANAASHSIAVFSTGATGTIKYRSCVGACTKTPNTVGLNGLAMAPNGRSLYATAAGSRSVLQFTRSASSGKLTPVRSKTGCLVPPGGDAACSAATLFGSGAPSDIAVAPDGRALYYAVPANSSIVGRQLDTGGGLRDITPPGDCATSRTESTCLKTPPLVGAERVAIAPDGGTVYASAPGSDAVVALGRNPANGMLSLRGAGACVSARAVSGCGLRADPFTTPRGVAPSTDGRSVYVAVSGVGVVQSFDAGGGTIRQMARPQGCLAGSVYGCRFGAGLGGVEELRPTPDGLDVIASSTAGTVVALRRDRVPSCTADQEIGVGGATRPTRFRLDCTDPDGDRIGFRILRSTAAGQLSVAGETLSYLPASRNRGRDGFVAQPFADGVAGAPVAVALQTNARIAAKFRTLFRTRGSSTRVARLRLSAVPLEARIELRCGGRRSACGGLRRKRLKAPKRSSRMNLAARLPRRTLRAGARLEVRLTASGRTGQVRRYRIRSGRGPVESKRCLRPGSKKPRRCPR